MWDDAFEALLRDYLPFLPTEQALHQDTSLRDLGLDSLATVELLATMEQHYGVRLEADALTLETFATPGRLWTAISAVTA